MAGRAESRQIDLNVDWIFAPFLYITESPIEQAGPRRPAVLFSDSPFWAQGLTVGLRFGF
jgi:hypothetical protein